MRKLLLCATLAVAGCATVDRVAGPPVPRSIPAPQNQDPWAAAVTGIADAQLAIASEDERSGVIQTQWVETFTKYSAASPPSRRLMFSVRVDDRQVTVAPIPEVCGPTGACRATDTLTETELAISDRLVGSIEAHLRARVGTREREVRVQAGREPPPAQPIPEVEVHVRTPPVDPRPPVARGPIEPDREGPVVIDTHRAGHQEVAAGRIVEVELMSGHRVSGEIVGVSEDGIAVDVGNGGDPVILWERDIAQVITR